MDTASRIFADAATRLGVDPLDQEQVDSLTVRVVRRMIQRRNQGLTREQARLRRRDQLIPCRDTDPQPPVDNPGSDSEGDSISEYTVSGGDSSSNTEAWDSDDSSLYPSDLPELVE